MEQQLRRGLSDAQELIPGDKAHADLPRFGMAGAMPYAKLQQSFRLTPRHTAVIIRANNPGSTKDLGWESSLSPAGHFL